MQPKSIIVGSQYPGVTLPMISPDYSGMSRHAVGTLSMRGHRDIVLVHSSRVTAGRDLLSAGFVDGCANCAHGEIRSRILEFSDEPVVFDRMLRSLFQRKDAPTALVLTSSQHAVTALTSLMRAGRRIPEDVSIICAAQASSAHYTIPALAHYTVISKVYLSKLLRLIHQVREEAEARRRVTLIFPGYQPGGSVGHAPIVARDWS